MSARRNLIKIRNTLINANHLAEQKTYQYMYTWAYTPLPAFRKKKDRIERNFLRGGPGRCKSYSEAGCHFSPYGVKIKSHRHTD